MTNRLFGLTLAAAALLALPLLGGCQDVDTELKAPEYKTGLPAGETRISPTRRPSRISTPRTRKTTRRPS